MVYLMHFLIILYFVEIKRKKKNTEVPEEMRDVTPWGPVWSPGPEEITVCELHCV